MQYYALGKSATALGTDIFFFRDKISEMMSSMELVRTCYLPKQCHCAHSSIQSFNSLSSLVSE